MSHRDKSPEFYKHYPRLFHAYFIDVPEKTVSDLSDAGYLYYECILMLDAVFDNKDLSNLIKVFSLQEETIRILTSIYGRESEFWRLWERRKKEYFEAITIEKKMNYDNAQWVTFEDLADKKAAFGKIAIDAMFMLSNKKFQQYEMLLQSHAYFSVGLQLYDDVKDFTEDMTRNQFNWGVYRLKQQMDFDGYDIPTLNKYLFLKGVGQELLRKAITYFDKALDVLDPYKIESEWIKTIQDTRNTISLYLDNTEGYLKSIIKKMELKKQTNTAEFISYRIENQTICKGLNYIKEDFSHHYAELKHIMYLSKQADNFDNTDQVHCSDTFQRAILNNCLIDITDKYHIDAADFIQREINYLIELRNHDSVGGWSYYPTVREIAADADDLGQIIQLFIKSGHPGLVEKYCEPAIKIALENKYNKDGGIATWLIPNTNRTEIQEKQIFFNETKWGTGPDMEVVANFIYALHLYNPEKYNQYILDAVDYIIKGQHEDGYWNSRWYYGSMYGTYICLRLLKSYISYSISQISIELALDFLRIIQNEDGGFGLYKGYPSDSLSTAFAIMAYKLFSGKTDTVIRNAERFLIKSQHENGCWEAINFIKPKVEEPYKSRTLTTACVLQSLSV